MATTLSRADKMQLFPLEILRSLIPMIIGGLASSQLRIRQSTYRFLVGGGTLGMARWLSDKDGVDLIEAMEDVSQEYEADVYTPRGDPVDQITDFATMILDQYVEFGLFHPTTLTPRVEKDSVKWVWHDPSGREFGLGVEEVFTKEQHEIIFKRMNARV